MPYLYTMKHTTTTYNVTKGEKYSASTRDFRDAFEVRAATFDAIGCLSVDILATYSDEASARRVCDALTAQAGDLA